MLTITVDHLEFCTNESAESSRRTPDHRHRPRMTLFIDREFPLSVPATSPAVHTSRDACDK